MFARETPLTIPQLARGPGLPPRLPHGGAAAVHSIPLFILFYFSLFSHMDLILII